MFDSEGGNNLCTVSATDHGKEYFLDVEQENIELYEAFMKAASPSGNVAPINSIDV